MPELTFGELPSPTSASSTTCVPPGSNNNTLPRSGGGSGINGTPTSAKKRVKPCSIASSSAYLPPSSATTPISSTSAAVAASTVTTTPTTATTQMNQNQRSFVRQQCPRARRIRFFRNGDQYFKGVWYAVSTERYRSFEALLEDLNRSIVGGDMVSLPHGVRCLFTIDGQRKIGGLDELIDGESYVCTSNESSFKRIDYENAREPTWSYSLPKQSRIDGSAFLMSPGGSHNYYYCGGGAATAATNGGGGTSTNNGGASESTSATFTRSTGGVAASSSGTSPENIDFVYPKIITVVKNGVKPRRAVRLLLNKRTARSFAHVLGEISMAIKLNCGSVKKLFTLSGKQVTSLCDFFRADDVFIACGSEKMSVDDFYLDSEEYKCLWSPKLRLPPPSNVVRNANNDGLVSSGSTRTPPFGRRAVDNNNGGGTTSSPTTGYRTSTRHHRVATARPSPVLRRRFLNQKNQNKLKPKLVHDDYVVNDASPYCSESCLSVASSSFTSVLYPPEIDEKFEIGGVIGDGFFAVVRKCIYKDTNEEIALKIIDKAKCVGKEEMVVDVEVQLLRRLDHPCIVKLLGFWDIDDRFYLAIEFVPGGDLFDALVSARYFSECEAAQMMTCLYSALEYLHDLNIVHRDVKPENLLVSEMANRKQLKLADFGLAAEVKEPLFTVCGTPTYVAPEILAETGYGVKVDIWAAGVILYIMLCGFPPFVSMSNKEEELFEVILSGNYEFRRPYWNHISNAAKGLIQGMLQLDADDRYSASEVLIHPWITSEANVDQDFEQASSLANHAAEEQRERLEAREFYHSRRRSVDDFSTTSADGVSTFSKDNTDLGPTESSG